MTFTFGIITYNQSKYVVETLESIKYQIINFGKTESCKLIVGDDCSSDDTLSTINNWISYNGGLFCDIEIIEHKKNVGLNRNYVDVLSRIKTTHYKIIAGDDLFCSENVFDWPDDKNICTYIPIILKNEELIIERKTCAQVFYYMKNPQSNGNSKYKIAFGDYMNTPSVFITKEMMSDDVINRILEYRNFEDDPGWFFALSENESFSTSFYFATKTIYRIHEESLSHGLPTEKNKIFFDDLCRFKLSCSKKFGFGFKGIMIFLVYLYLKLMKLSKYTIYISPIHYILKYKYRYYEWWIKRHCKDEFESFYNELRNNIKKEYKYYNVIKTSCGKY